MLKRSPTFEKLIARLNRLPGIGKKSAERLAYHILKSSKEDARALANAITEVKNRIFFCPVCFNLTETAPCEICSDESRDRSRILVVETSMDVAAFERSGVYRGLYHVLQGRLVPLKGFTPDKLRIQELLERVKSDSFSEIILATNPDVEGDATALYLALKLKNSGLRISRIGLGLPMGGSLEYVDGYTLEKALEGRKDF